MTRNPTGDRALRLQQHPRPRGVAVVTGGSAGLGRAIVRELAARGWDVAILARGLDGLAGAAHDVELAGRRALAVETDVADNAQVEAAAERIESELGPIELWVNNAMTGVFGEFLDAEPEDYERVTRVVYLGTVNGTRAALSRMKPRDRGHIIQIGSALAHRGIPLQSAYCGAKHAITGFTESVLTELLHDGSQVKISQVDMPALNTIQFDWVKSSLPEHPQPVPPVYQPEAGARAVADVADRPRRRTWVGGPTVATVLGNRAASRFLDVYLARTGFRGQQAPDKGKGLSLPSNLYEPVPGDHGARGVFDDRAMDDSPQLWALRHERTLTAAAVAAAVAGAAALVARAARRS
ncbi:SDR family oxidoreductase [Gryllotalpicola daejeonensis]|uniref:SDR family oxidoreductase n=1 Tax=Gryllotalpicola daejeonensis TaxID=993087 RepID=A0ABP7ZMW9_9MICO